MTEEGFDFRPPVERRDPKRFEPPPWERDAFDELERRRAEQEAAEARAREALEVRAAADADEVSGPAPVPAVVSTGPEAASAGASDPAEPEAGGTAAPPEAEVLEMLAGLAAEEPRTTGAYVPVALGTGIALLALGGMMVVWAMAALVGSRQTGSLGQVSGAGLGLFGIFFLSMGVWLVYRTLKQRGVL